MRLFLTLVALAAVSVSGFSILPYKASLSSRNHHAGVLHMSEAPSDTSTDDIDMYVVEEEQEEEDTTLLVNSVLLKLPTYLADIADQVRTDLNEAILKLEAANPTSNPAMSPLLNGVWELRYAGGYSPDWALPSPTRQLALFLYSGGYSPGLFALALAQQLPSALVDVGDLEISISRDQPRVEAKVTTLLFNGSLENSVTVRARLEAQSGVRLKETYEGATVMDQDVSLPTQIQYSRDLYVTYVDEDLLVVRDASGVPEVLVRKVKQFKENWGIEPSALDDMVPPGEELPATD